ncbi:DUF4199 domain-containing protein [Mucilaginibacter segetis]|uniref:DUF4199 domain-containing protein n=1 Tax=Mucilaginibacter segetis TaxID=2793071 RepID=A0A934PQM3_9SPHI|nr:DUF4199 domain-containing protein [Mucilaginibacter segetis]MBK0378963.1 DUF4199 domain-containing protein [Mucilaginibacter segetis]
MTDQLRSKTINNLSLKYGLLIGGISIVLSVIFRIIDPLLQFTNTWISLLAFVIVIVLLVIFGIEVRKNVGGFWNYGEAFRSLIIMSVFISILTVLYSFILFKYIDPELPTKVNAAILDNLTTKLSNMGLDQSKMDEITKPFENGEFEAKFKPTFKNELTNFGFGLLIYAVIDLIIAAIIKKRPPMFAPVVEDDLDTDPVV